MTLKVFLCYGLTLARVQLNLHWSDCSFSWVGDVYQVLHLAPHGEQ